MILINDLKFRQANALEIITLGQDYSDLQNRVSIMALGDYYFSTNGQPYFIVLDAKNSKRRLRSHHAYCAPGINYAILVFPETDTYPSSIIKPRIIEESIIKH